MGKFKKSLSVFSFVFLGLISWGQTIPDKPEPAVYVNDFAKIFDGGQRGELEQMLINYYDSTSTQIVVVTVSSLEGMDAGQYATELGEKWGVGQKKQDNGVVFLVATKDRKMFIASGRGTEEKLTDVFLGRLRDNYILPEFKKGDYYSGVRLGVIQMINRLNGTFQKEQVDAGEESNLPMVLIIIIILIIAFFVFRPVNYSETYSGRGYRGGLGGFWGGGFGGGDSSWGGGSSGGSFGGGSFGGGGAGGDW